MSNQKTQPSQRLGEERIYLLVAKKNTGNISQKSNSSQIKKSFKQKAHEYLRRGLSRAEFIIELGQRFPESKLWLIEVWGINIIIPSSTWVGGPSSCRTQICIRLLCISLEKEPGLCCILNDCFLTTFPLFLHSLKNIRY